MTVPVKGKLALGRVLHVNLAIKAYTDLEPETRPASTAAGPQVLPYTVAYVSD